MDRQFHDLLVCDSILAVGHGSDVCPRLNTFATDISANTKKRVGEDNSCGDWLPDQSPSLRPM